MEAGVVLVAAGEGRRFGGPKAFADLEGKPLVEWAASAFASFRDRVVVVRGADRPRVRWPGWKVVEGGPRRRDSVQRGLLALDPRTEVALVHDAARPLVSAGLVARVLEAALRFPAVVPAVPVPDTLKRVRDEAVAETLPREGVVLVQTPQAFRTDLLRRALEADGGDATDEAALVERLGEPVRVVPGEPWNVKVTAPADLSLVRALLRGGIR